MPSYRSTQPKMNLATTTTPRLLRENLTYDLLKKNIKHSTPHNYNTSQLGVPLHDALSFRAIHNQFTQQQKLNNLPASIFNENVQPQTAIINKKSAKDRCENCVMLLCRGLSTAQCHTCRLKRKQRGKSAQKPNANDLKTFI